MILIDPRRGSNSLYEPLSKKVPCQMDEQIPADLAFEGFVENGRGLIGIEYKKLSDALDSMLNGRLAGYQLVTMMDYFQQIYLIVEGLWRPEPSTGAMEVWVFDRQKNKMGWVTSRKGSRVIMYKEFDNFLTTMTNLTPFKFRRTSTQAETIQTVADLFDWHQKPWNKHTSHLALHTPARPGDRVVHSFRRPSLRRIIANDLPGVAYERSKDVEGFFPNTLSMINASPDEWREALNIKDKNSITAEKIYKTLRSE